MVLFPNLEIVKASLGLSKKDIAKIIDKAPSAVTEKLSGETEFKLTEMLAIQKYVEKNKNYLPGYMQDIELSLDYIFYRNDNYSNQSKQAV